MATTRTPKVCILSTVHDVDDTRIFYKEALSLRKFGYDVTYIVPHHKEEIIENIHIIPLSSHGNRFFRMTFRVWKAFRKAMKEKADIYHFHDPELIPAGLLLKLLGKKVIYDVHEDLPRQLLSKHWIYRPLRKWVSRTVEVFENFAVRRMSAVISVTPHIVERLKKNNSNTYMVCNYPKLDEFAKFDSQKDITERTVCYVGGIATVRGIVEMVEAIGKTDGVLLLAGSFSSEQLREDVTNLDGWKQVKELGFLNREQVGEVLASSCAGIYAGHPIINYVTSLPIKVFEYMAAGIPVITSNFPILKEIVEGNECGICVNPLDPDSIASAIQWIFEHPEKAKVMGERGKRAVEEMYNWEIESGKLKELYESLLGVRENEIRREEFF